MAGTEKASRIVGPARKKLAEDLVKKYDSGASVRQLAAKLKRSYGFVHAILKEGGVTFRQRGGQPGPQSSKKENDDL